MPQVLSPTREATTRGSLCPTPGAWLPLAATRESPCGGEDPAQPKIKKEKKTTLKPYTGVYARRHTHTHTHTPLQKGKLNVKMLIMLRVHLGGRFPVFSSIFKFLIGSGFSFKNLYC